MKKYIYLIVVLFVGFLSINAQTTTNYGVGSGTAGSDNSFFGYKTGHITAGSGNSYLGSLAGADGKGEYNCFVGYAAGINNGGSFNVFMGVKSADINTVGKYNTFIGSETGRFNVKGNGNVFLGYRSGFNETGSDRLYIDNSDTKDPLIYGLFDKDILRVNGEFQIGNPSTTGYSFPIHDGTLKQLLQTNGNGTLQWVDRSAIQDRDWYKVGTTSAPTSINDDIFTKGQVGIGLNPFSNATLTVGTDANVNTNVIIKNGYSRLQIGKAACNWCYAPKAVPGTTVFRNLGGSHNLIFNMPNDDNNGTTNIRINDDVNYNSFVVFNNGKVTIGTEHFDNQDYNLYVINGIKTEKIKVEVAAANGWADYVFEDDYQLKNLKDLENYIKVNKHLPEVPTTQEAIKNGIELKEMNILLLKKIEELTLYLIDQDKKIEELSKKIK
jgi:hypothetical protein